MSTKNSRQVPVSTRNVFLFILITVGIGWFGRYLDHVMQSPPQQGLGMLLWLIAPALFSLFLRAFAGDKWGDLGLKPGIKGNTLWYLLSVLFYPFCILIILVLGALCGVITFPILNTDSTHLLLGLLMGALIPQLATNIFEEVGIRGYLAPKISALNVHDLLGHIYVGIVWGLWHIPYFSDITSYSSESHLTLIPRFILGTIAGSILLGELRVLTKSFWPAVLFQTVGGIVLTPLIAPGSINIQKEWQIIFSPLIDGTLTILFSLIMGIGIYMWRTKRKNIAI